MNSRNFKTPTMDEIKKMKTGTPIPVLITPHLAGQLLGLRDRNYRQLRPYWVSALSHQMSINKWEMNYSDNVVLCRDGDDQIHLMDAQHRMGAVVESGTTQPFLLIVVDEKDYVGRVEGMAKVRSAIDDFRHRGINDQRVASTVRLLCVQEGIYHRSVTRDMILEVYDQFSAAVDCMRKHAPRNQLGWRAELHSILVRAWFRYDEDVIASFCQKVAEVEFADKADAGAKYVYMVMQDGLGPRGFPKNFAEACESGFYYFAEGRGAEAKKSGGRQKGIRPNIRPVTKIGMRLPLPPIRYPGVEIGSRGTRSVGSYAGGKNSILRVLVDTLRMYPGSLFSSEELATAAKIDGSSAVPARTRAGAALVSALERGTLPEDIVILDKQHTNWFICDPR